MLGLSVSLGGCIVSGFGEISESDFQGVKVTVRTDRTIFSAFRGVIVQFENCVVFRPPAGLWLS